MLDPPPVLPVFCAMNVIILFLILHIYTGTKDTNLHIKDTELKYRYLIGHKSMVRPMFLHS